MSAITRYQGSNFVLTSNRNNVQSLVPGKALEKRSRFWSGGNRHTSNGGCATLDDNLYSLKNGNDCDIKSISVPTGYDAYVIAHHGGDYNNLCSKYWIFISIMGPRTCK